MKKFRFITEKKYIIVSLIILFCLVIATVLRFSSGKAGNEITMPENIVAEKGEYDLFLEKYADAKHPDVQLAIDLSKVKSCSDSFKFTDEGIYTDEEGTVTFEFEVEEAGLYSIELTYFTTEGKNNAIERRLLVNDEIPYTNASFLKFSRVWTNGEEIKRDSRGNDVRPKQTEVNTWVTEFITDGDGYYTEPFEFYFKKGKNTLTFVSEKEPMLIGKIVLKQPEKLPSYAQYKELIRDKADQAKVSDSFVIQGEDAKYKSDSTLYPTTDRTSPLTVPYHASKTRLNTIGSTNWNREGQWLTWEMEVKESGFYEISIKYRQNINTGLNVNRTLYIDDEIPFEEAKECKFYYGNDWQNATLGNEDGAYLFWLEKGTHTLKLSVTLSSEMAEMVRRVDYTISELNRAYRYLLMVIGSSPDTMRDYQLEKKCPEALEILKEQYENIVAIKALSQIISEGSEKGQSTTVDNLMFQLEKLNEKPKQMAKQWSAFKDNIVSLGSWELSLKEQPLEIDYITVHTPDYKLERVKANFFEKVGHEVKHFLASFVEDYDSIGEVYEGEALEVWLLADGAVTSMTGSGRDQATVIKDLIDNYFVSRENIPVNVKLVNKDVLLSATLAGKGPDVALNLAGKEPINYALRNAVYDLTNFDDFEEVRKWFYKDALTQFTFEGGVYALPQTMSFHVMFYRKDVLDDLGIEVPQTWDEFYDALATIQKANMNIGITPDYTTFAMFLYQHGGEYYTADGMESGLSSEEAIAAFKQWSGNYSNYKMPVTYDFANRFRTGEMPLAIGDYTNYNYLAVFAPEIRGLWDFTLVPGYEREDGTLDHTVSAWESASVIMKTSDQKNEAWKFLKWWMSAETQSLYGNGIENVLGVSGRVATANIEALSQLPWSAADYRTLLTQMDYVKAIPEIPGSYYTERNIKNAFYTVYNNNEDPRETLADIVTVINKEIDSKREEFGLPLKNR